MFMNVSRNHGSIRPHWGFCAAHLLVPCRHFWFSIGSAERKCEWFRIGSVVVPCLQGTIGKYTFRYFYKSYQPVYKKQEINIMTTDSKWCNWVQCVVCAGRLTKRSFLYHVTYNGSQFVIAKIALYLITYTSVNSVITLALCVCGFCVSLSHIWTDRQTDLKFGTWVK